MKNFFYQIVFAVKTRPDKKPDNSAEKYKKRVEKTDRQNRRARDYPRDESSACGATQKGQ